MHYRDYVDCVSAGGGRRGLCANLRTDQSGHVQEHWIQPDRDAQFGQTHAASRRGRDASDLQPSRAVWLLLPASPVPLCRIRAHVYRQGGSTHWPLPRALRERLRAMLPRLTRFRFPLAHGARLLSVPSREQPRAHVYGGPGRARASRGDRATGRHVWKSWRVPEADQA